MNVQDCVHQGKLNAGITPRNRACVQCFELKVKCDGVSPCSRCQRFGRKCTSRTRIQRAGYARKKLSDLKQFERLAQGAAAELSFIDLDLYKRDVDALCLLAATLGWEVQQAVPGEPNMELALWHIATSLTNALARRDFPGQEALRFFRGHLLVGGLMQLGLVYADSFAQFDGQPQISELFGGTQFQIQTMADASRQLFAPYRPAEHYGFDFPVATMQVRASYAPQTDGSAPNVLIVNDAFGSLFHASPAAIHQAFLQSGMSGMTFWLQLVAHIAIDHVLRSMDKFPASFVSRINRVNTSDVQKVRMRQPMNGEYRWLEMRSNVRYTADSEVHTMQIVPMDAVAEHGGCLAM